MCTYRGGRFVLGSGRTWPHDFRFLAGRFSAPGAGVAAASSAAEAARAAAAEAFLSSEKDRGVMITSGFIVATEAAGLDDPKSGGYISPGMDRKDSAGEFSNLTSGDGVSWSQESILAVFVWLDVWCSACSTCAGGR